MDLTCVFYEGKNQQVVIVMDVMSFKFQFVLTQSLCFSTVERIYYEVSIFLFFFHTIQQMSK